MRAGGQLEKKHRAALLAGHRDRHIFLSRKYYGREQNYRTGDNRAENCVRALRILVCKLPIA